MSTSVPVPPLPAPGRPRRPARAALIGAGALWLVGWLATWPTTPAEAPMPVATLEDAATNAVPLYEAAHVLHEFIDTWPQKQPGSPNTPAERAYVAANGRALALFHEARALPGASMGPADQPVLARARHETRLYAALKDLVYLASLKMEIALAAGRHAEALEASADATDAIFKLAAAPGQDTLGLALTSATQLINRGYLERKLPALLAAPEPALAAYARALDATDRRRHPFEQAILVEGEGTTGGAWLAEEDFVGSGEIPEPRLRLAALADVIGPSRELRRRWAAHNAALARARDPRVVAVRERPERPDGRTMLRAYLGLPFHPAEALAEQQALRAQLGVQAVATRWLYQEAQFQGLRVRVALARHARAHGKPAARLQDLVPAYLPAVPADPFMPERPLGYDGAKIWSVGADRVDQHGAPAQPRFPKQVPGYLSGEEPLDLIL